MRTQLSAALTAIVYQRLLPRVGGGLVGAFEVLVANSASATSSRTARPISCATR